MFALVVSLGTPPIQLPDRNQLEETTPVQSDWACAETADAMKSAIAASNLGEGNLQPARARNVAPRRGSHPTSAPRVARTNPTASAAPPKRPSADLTNWPSIVLPPQQSRSCVPRRPGKTPNVRVVYYY